MEPREIVTMEETSTDTGMHLGDVAEKVAIGSDRKRSLSGSSGAIVELSDVAVEKGIMNIPLRGRDKQKSEAGEKSWKQQLQARANDKL